MKKSRNTLDSLKKNPFSVRNALIYIVVFAIVGGIILLLTHAATTTVTYTGSWNKRRPSVNYNIAPTATGNLAASLNFTKVSKATMTLTDSSGATIASQTGPSPLSISAPVNIAAYTLTVTASGSGSYTLNVTYPTPTPPASDTTPPTISISSPAAAASLNGTVSVFGSAADNVSVSKVEVSTDSGTYQLASGTSSWSYPLNTTTLTNGAHTINARATDSSSNAGNASVTVNVNNPVADTAAPTAPANLTSSSPAANSISLSWTASTDNVGVLGYNIYRNGAKLSSVPGTSFTDTGLTAGTTYSYYVSAYDAAGNTSSPSNTLSVTTPNPDTTKPTVSITAPGSGSTVAGTITIGGTASDNIALASVTLRIDSGAIITPSGTASWTYNWDTTFYANGTHTITATATDSSGNTNIATSTVTVSNQTTGDTTKPTMNWPLTATNPMSGTSAQFGTYASDDDFTGVTAAAYSVNGGPLVSIPITPSTFPVINGTMDSTKYPDGTYTLTVYAYDAAGNNAFVSATMTIRNTAHFEDKTFSDGLHVTINSVGTNPATGTYWTADDAHNLMIACALGGGDFATIAPLTHVQVQDIYPSATVTSVGSSGTPTVYTDYQATLSLQARPGTSFALEPNGIGCHEYGHVWTLYHLYITQNNNINLFLNERWVTSDGSVTLATDSRTNTSYMWSAFEIMAEDYRLLIGAVGDPKGVSDTTQMNYQITDARNQPGLKDWYLNTWK